MKRLACGACSNGNFDLILDLGETPIANCYPLTGDEQEIWYPLQLGRCLQCGLVQLMEIVPDTELYGKDYGFYSGGSAPQLEYHRQGAELLLKRYPEQAHRGVMEVACNDGSLLQHFRDAGCPSIGVDPAEGPTRVARERGIKVYQSILTTGLADDIRRRHGTPGLVIAYNSMAHVEDLSETLNAIRLLMDDESVAVFEVQYLPDMIAGNMYDQVYHEHRFFYSLTSLRQAAALHGLYVIEAELIELQNGGLRVTLSTDRDAYVSRTVQWIENEEMWLKKLNLDQFQGMVDRTVQHFRSIVDLEHAHDKKIGGYGAAAKATTILNYAQFGWETIDFIIDTTSHKQGKFLPGVGIPIIAPEDAPEVDTMILLASNYLSTVLRTNPHKGSWIVPLPVPRMI